MQKSVICVTNTSDTLPSSCPLIIKGIKPHQQIDLCTGHCTNLELIDNADSPSTVVVTGPIPNAFSEWLANNCR